MENKVEQLKERFLKLFSFDGFENTDLQKIEKCLAINLPKAFINIAEFFKDQIIANRFLFTINSDVNEECSITGATLLYRKNARLPNKYLALEETEVSITLLDTETGQVLYLAVEDVYNLCEGNPLKYDPIIYPSFTDFFEYLLDEEEKMREKEYAAATSTVE